MFFFFDFQIRSLSCLNIHRDNEITRWVAHSPIFVLHVRILQPETGHAHLEMDHP